MAATKKAKKGVKPSGAVESPANTLEDHSLSASEMAAKTPTKGRTNVSTSTADAQTAERIADETKESSEERDNSVGARLARSEYFLHEDQHGLGEWIGKAEPPCESPRHRCRHTPLGEIEPRAGLRVQVSENEAFAIPMDTPRGLSAAGWLTVVNPNGGKALIS